MSRSLVVPVVELENVRNHPNADKLDLADVLGYQMAIPKGKYKSGDKVVYFPADTLLPEEWADKFGCRDFLKGKEKDRVGKIRLRGEPSFGLVVDIPEGLEADLGDNVADYFGCKKYEPPIKTTAGDAAKYNDLIDPFIERYTDIENGRIFVDVFEDGEEVIVTEKLHGSNCKVGTVKDVDIFAGSMSYRRKRPVKPKWVAKTIWQKIWAWAFGIPNIDAEFDDEEMRRNTYWHPWTIKGVEELINELAETYNVVILYGEVIGGSVQKLTYGIPKGQGIGFRAFDLKVDGKYLDWGEFKELCDKHNVPTVPVLYRGAFSIDKVKELADGESTLEGASHIREGVVVKPVKERTDIKIGRAVLKYIGTEYELSKHAKEDATDV